MKIHRLTRHQILPVSLERAWEFFSDPGNLPVITPPELSIRVISGAETPLRAGQIITYTITPFPGIPVEWKTKITEVDPGRRFIDLQVEGPYKLWKHTHSFRTINGSVEVRDDVKYVLPFGFLGTLAHTLIIKNQLRKIFDYRENMLKHIFPMQRELVN